MATSRGEIDQRSAARADNRIAYLPLLFLLCAVVLARDRMPAWAFMWALAIAIYAALKWASWWRSPVRAGVPWARSIEYLLTWPGMDADSFLAADRRVSAPRASALSMPRFACDPQAKP